MPKKIKDNPKKNIKSNKKLIAKSTKGIIRYNYFWVHEKDYHTKNPRMKFYETLNEAGLALHGVKE